MKFTTKVLFAASTLIATISAQVSYDNATDTWKCPISDGAYCAGDSLTTPVVILCTNGTGTPGNCIPHNWSRPPADVHYSQCYESSPTAGDAACAKSCTVYPDSGFPFPVPGNSCNATALNQVDVTNGAVATTCREGMLPNSNKTGTICDSSAPSLNGTANGHNFNSTNGTSPTVHDPTKTSSKGAASPTETGAAVALGAGPMIGYAVLGLLAFIL